MTYRYPQSEKTQISSTLDIRSEYISNQAFFGASIKTRGKAVKKFLVKVLRLSSGLYQRYKVKAAIARLLKHENEKLKAIGGALNELLEDAFSPDERGWITLIEQRRSFLLNSDNQITIRDYGAGNRNSNRTKEEMENGVESIARVADICRTSSKPEFWATLLFKLVRKLQPLSCLELGSCVGISASYQAAALKINGKGNLVTLEGSPETAKIAEDTLRSLDLKNTSVITGPFHKTLKNALESASPIDLFFNDGHHDRDAVLRYFNESIPHLSPGAIIVVDDISWSPGMREAWVQIEHDPRVGTSIDLGDMGIAVVKDEFKTKENFRILL